MRFNYLAVDIQDGSLVTALAPGEQLTGTLQDCSTGNFFKLDGSWGVPGDFLPMEFNEALQQWVLVVPDEYLVDGHAYELHTDGINGRTRPMTLQVLYVAGAATSTHSLASEIARYLSAEGLGVFSDAKGGGDIFVDTMPDAAASGICVYTTGGSPPDTATSIARPTLQVLVRGARARETCLRARAILAMLRGLRDIRLTNGGTRIMLCIARQSEPIPLGRDENGRYQYSVNFQFITGGD